MSYEIKLPRAPLAPLAQPGLPTPEPIGRAYTDGLLHDALWRAGMIQLRDEATARGVGRLLALPAHLARQVVRWDPKTGEYVLRDGRRVADPRD